MDVSTRMALIKGTPIQLGTAVYVCPALNIKGMREFREELSMLEKGLSEEDKSNPEARDDFLAKLVTVTTAALLRNYPSINEDAVAEGLDFNNIRTVTMAVLGASGFTTADSQAAELSIFGKPEQPSGE
jgi:DNA-binding MurR/RpiR family transcriptional regulator